MCGGVVGGKDVEIYAILTSRADRSPPIIPSPLPSPLSPFPLLFFISYPFFHSKKQKISREPKVLYSITSECMDVEGCRMGRIGFLPVLGTMKACEMPRLRKLMLSENDLTPSLCVLLVSVLNSNEELIVNELDMSDNQISDGGCGAIANFLAFSNEEYIDEEINTLNIGK